MATKCRALTRSGKQCLAFARRDDPAGLCVYHSRLSASGEQRSARPLTKEDLLKLIEATIRQVRHAKLNALERSRELRALLVERDKLLTGEPEEKEPGTLDDKVRRWKSQTS